jgi:hypothetical protein
MNDQTAFGGMPPMAARFAGPLFAAWGERMRAEALRELLDGASRRTGIPPASASTRQNSAWSNSDPATLHSIRQAAVAERGTPWPQALASDYARYFRDGDRLTYETAVGARQQRLARAVLMAAAGSGEPHPADDPQAWIDEVGDGVTLLCEQSSWSWAAHDDTNSRFGHVVPTASSPYLDLGAGEVVAQLAWVDHVLGDALDARIPGLRARIRHEAAFRVFEPFVLRRDWWWIGDTRPPMNWNAWIHGNVIAAAVLLLDDAGLPGDGAVQRAEVVALALEGLDRYLAELPDDGAVDEGFAYWWQGAARMLECLAFVSNVTGGALDARKIPVVRQVLRFPMRMQLGGPWYYNVADGPAELTGTEPWHIPFRWGLDTGDDEVVRHASGGRRPGHPLVSATAGLGRMLHALADPDWRDTTPAAAPLPKLVWLPSVQVMLARESAGESGGLALAVKGGHNGENHNHKDVGSFVVALDGRPVVVDAGQPTYTAQTFGADRYALRVMQSGWHNAPAPLGLEQGEGREFAARLVHAPGDTAPLLDRRNRADTDAITLELAGAYPLPPGSSWRRRAVLDRGQRVVRIEDEWALGASGTAEPTAVHLLLAGEVTADGTGVRVRNRAAASALLIDWGDATLSAQLEEWMLDDERLEKVWGPSLTRLTLELPRSAGSLTMTMGAAQ